ncbi:MAG TPA: LPS-assembly protein LptD, partial [Legionellaceae bacterium]|nr:LPS-assembly protein LptD [Legionellaceae bacterium]
RYHLNPVLSFPKTAPWGYFEPSVELVENNYSLFSNTNAQGNGLSQSSSFNRALPRVYIDSGLTFERDTHLFANRMRQTLEPRLFYLWVPYENQNQFPSFDSAYMIFNADQLFRTNRFSGFDRISDANQLAYAATTRWYTEKTGQEKASVTIGQIRYFSPRKLQLCYSPDGQCTDSPAFLGYTSPETLWSPMATRAVYTLNSAWSASADFVWDFHYNNTNNANLNLHYQPTAERILALGYNYLANGNMIIPPPLGVVNPIFNPVNTAIISDSLHQITGSYAWPLTDHWSTLGVYSYNISTQYDMLSFFGIQYDSCCWAARVIGGRTFKSLSPDAIPIPQYNNNIYFQIVLKGLGSAGTSNPASTVYSYLPGYPNLFK